MEKPKIFSRLGHWLRGSERVNGETGVEDADPARQAESVEAAPLTTGDPESAGTGRFRLSRPGATLERLEEEYRRIVKLFDSIQEHFASHAERSATMVQSVNRMVDGLGGVAELSRQQQLIVTQIQESTATSAASAKRVEEGLLQLPQLADAQRETMVSIGRQLDFSRQTMERVSGSMDGFQQAIRNLAAVTETSTKKLEEIRWDAGAREERVASLLERQNRLLTKFAWSALGVGGVAAVIALASLFR